MLGVGQGVRSGPRVSGFRGLEDLKATALQPPAGALESSTGSLRSEEGVRAWPGLSSGDPRVLLIAPCGRCDPSGPRTRGSFLPYWCRVRGHVHQEHWPGHCKEQGGAGWTPGQLTSGPLTPHPTRSGVATTSRQCRQKGLGYESPTRAQPLDPAVGDSQE